MSQRGVKIEPAPSDGSWEFAGISVSHAGQKGMCNHSTFPGPCGLGLLPPTPSHSPPSQTLHALQDWSSHFPSPMARHGHGLTQQKQLLPRLGFDFRAQPHFNNNETSCY